MLRWVPEQVKPRRARPRRSPPGERARATARARSRMLRARSCPGACARSAASEDRLEFHRLSVVGGGMNGKSIAQKVASNGIDVVVLEVSEERAAKAREELAANLDEELRKWGITASEKKVILSRVEFVHEESQKGPRAGEVRLIE